MRLKKSIDRSACAVNSFARRKQLGLQKFFHPRPGSTGKRIGATDRRAVRVYAAITLTQHAACAIDPVFENDASFDQMAGNEFARLHFQIPGQSCDLMRIERYVSTVTTRRALVAGV